MANNEFIDILSPSALRNVAKGVVSTKELVKEINKAVQAQSRLTLSGGRSPSSSANNTNSNAQAIRKSNTLLAQQVTLLNNIADSLRQTNSATNTQTASIERQNRARTDSNARTQEEITNNRLLAANAARAAQANSTFATSYERLSAQQNISSRRLQDLIVRGRTADQTQRQYNRELRNAQREFNQLNARVLAADRAVGRFNRNVGNYPRQAANGLRDLISAFGVVGGVAAFAAITKNIFETTKQVQSLNFALKQVSGSTDAFSESQQFLSRISEAYGIELLGLTRSYTGFLAASRNAIDAGDISAAQIQDIFESVAKASGAMGLSVEQQEGAFLALQQMISKGNVQAEEIRGQLAERLPGAFGILAKSMGVTETQLNKLLKDGKVLAAEVLPAFAKELEKAYGVDNLNRVESLTAETIRLKNTWTEFVQSLQDGALNSVLVGILKVFSESLGGIAYLLQTTEQANKSFQKTLYDKTYADYYDSFKKEQDAATASAIKNGDKQVEAFQKGQEAASKSAMATVEYTNTFIAKNEEQIKSLDKTIAANEKFAESLSFFHLRTKEDRERIASIDEEKKKREELQNANISYQAQLAAAGKFIRGNEDKTTKNFGDNTKIKEERLKDFEATAYQLIRLRLEHESNIQRMIMDDEGKTLEQRKKAKEDYYTAQAGLSEEAYKEELRLINRNYNQEVSMLKKRLKDGEISEKNYSDVVSSLTRQRLYDRLIAEENNAEAVREIQRGLVNDLKAINADTESAKVGAIVSERELKANREYVGELRKIIEGNEDYHKILELEKKLKNDLLDIDQGRLQEEERAIEARLNRAIPGSIEYLNLEKELAEKIKERIEFDKQAADEAAENIKKLQKAAEDYVKSFAEGALGDLEFDSLNIFTKLEENGKTSFQNIIENAQGMANKVAAIVGSVGNVLSDVADFAAQNTQARFDAQYAGLEKQYQLDQEFNAKGEEAKAELQRKYDEKRREIRIQEAKAEKENALFKAIINTAQGVTAAIATANIPLSILIGALGAAQIAAIASRQIPAYEFGTANHPGGMAIVGDGGRAELIHQPNAGWSVSPSTPTLMNLEKGSIVLPDANAYRREVPAIDYNGGVSLDYEKLGNVVANNIPPATSINLNKRGISSFMIGASSRVNMYNNRISSTGRRLKG